MINPTECYLVGGGYSIKEAINQGLWDKLKGKFTISCNLSCREFPATFVSFVDCQTFYTEHLEELKQYPLLIGKYTKDTAKIKLENTIMLKEAVKYNRDLKEGVYHPFLAGLWTLSLAIYLLDVGTIYLLGFDGGALPSIEGKFTMTMKIDKKIKTFPVEDVTDRIDTLDKKSRMHLIHYNNKYYRIISHFYQEKFDHRGVGKTGFYHKTDKVNIMFDVFKNEEKCKIYNVSPQSNINAFEKIDYTTMFSKMDNVVYDQNELREHIKQRIGEIDERTNSTKSNS